jgi:hypothetical protein
VGFEIEDGVGSMPHAVPVDAPAVDVLGNSFEEKERRSDAHVERFCQLGFGCDRLYVPWAAGGGVTVVSHQGEQRRPLK